MENSDMYPDLLYMCLDCGATKRTVGIGTILGDLTCRCSYPLRINQMVQMIPKLPVKKPKDTRIRFRLRRKQLKKNMEKNKIQAVVIYEDENRRPKHCYDDYDWPF